MAKEFSRGNCLQLKYKQIFNPKIVTRVSGIQKRCRSHSGQILLFRIVVLITAVSLIQILIESLSFFSNKNMQQLELHYRSFLIYVVSNHGTQLESTKRHTLSLHYNILPFQYAYSYVLFLVSCLCAKHIQV